MECGQAREALSARLDDEDPGVPSAELDAHLAGCASCTAWEQAAANVTRMTRLAPLPAEDLATRRPVEDILAGVQLPTPSRWPERLRLLLAVIGLAQVALGVAQLFSGGHAHGGGAAGIHLGHETAAFNLAVGVALLWVASRPGQAKGQLPMLLSFVGVLTVVSSLDVFDGRVAGERLITHLPAMLGLVVTVLLVSPRFRGVDPDGGRMPLSTTFRSGASLPEEDLDDLPAPLLGLVGDRHRRPPAARRDVA